MSTSKSPKRRTSLPRKTSRPTASRSRSSSDDEDSHSASSGTPVRERVRKRESTSPIRDDIGQRRDGGRVAKVQADEEVKRRGSSDRKLSKLSDHESSSNASKKRKLMDDDESDDSKKKDKKHKKHNKHSQHKTSKADDDDHEEPFIGRVARSTSLEELEVQLRQRALRSMQESKLGTSVRRDKRSDDDD